MKNILIVVSSLLFFHLCGHNTTPKADVIEESSLQVRNAIAGFNSEEEIKEAYSLLEPERLEAFLRVFREDRKELYYRHTDTTDVAWNDTTAFFHYWKEMLDEDYLFEVPSPDSVARWKVKCEELNTTNGFNWIPSRYPTMNQYVTFLDLCARWRDEGRCIRSTEFMLWRLEQFRTDTLKPDSARARFGILKKVIEDVQDFDPFSTVEYNDLSGLRMELQEFYAEMIYREVLKHSDKKVIQSLKNEKEAWKNYHEALDSTIRVLNEDPYGLMGNTWHQTIWDAGTEDAFIWSCTLEDYYFYLADSQKPEKHKTIAESKVLQEYQEFMNTMAEEEYHHPIPARQKALKYEMTYWRKWMQSRAAVSLQLAGKQKEVYDIATNNARRMKYIMLKNRYQGYGLISNDVYEMLIPFTASDDDLDGPSFGEKWKELHGNSLY